ADLRPQGAKSGSGSTSRVQEGGPRAAVDPMQVGSGRRARPGGRHIRLAPLGASFVRPSGGPGSSLPASGRGSPLTRARRPPSRGAATIALRGHHRAARPPSRSAATIALHARRRSRTSDPPTRLALGPHEIAPEVLLSSQRVMRMTAQREIVRSRRPTECVRTHMVQLEKCHFPTALASDIDVSASRAIALPHLPPHGCSNGLTLALALFGWHTISLRLALALALFGWHT